MTTKGSCHQKALQQWQHVCHVLKKELGHDVFQNWIQGLKLHPDTPPDSDPAEVQSVALVAPNIFIQHWISSHYMDRIQELFSQDNPDLRVRLVVGDFEQKKTTPSSWSSTPSLPPIEEPHDQEVISSPLEERFTFDNFIVGKPNELAYAAARRVSDSLSVSFNPLFLYGGVGLGKTHLMHAIAHHIEKTQPNRQVIYLSAEKFMYQFIKALRYRDTMAFKDKFRSVNVLMIDDVQFINGKDSTQEEFFHTFNALVDQNHQVIVSADKSPSDLEGMEERLRSRLGWGLVADIHPTTYELRLGILQAKAATFQHPIGKKVLEFLAHNITSNVRELEGSLTRIMAHATLVGREIGLDMAQDVLKDLLRFHTRAVTVEEIQRKVGEYYKVRFSDMHSAKRSRAIARPRQVAMYLCKKLTTRSLPEIGRHFGGRDHTTVIHGIKKVQELTKSDSSLQEDIQILCRSFDHKTM